MEKSNCDCVELFVTGPAGDKSFVLRLCCSSVMGAYTLRSLRRA